MDLHTGIREVAEFFGPDEQKMFGCRHLPAERAVGGVVICSPLHVEFMRNYRREVVLARHLASLGLAVQRFHYRGTGNSDGETFSATYGSMVEDTIASSEWLKQAAGSDRLAFVGTRWGALMAAAGAARFESAPLVLWEPTLDSARYFRELFRALRIHELKRGAAGVRPNGSHEEEIRREGWLDVLGYSLHLPLFESSIDRTVEAELGDRQRPLLLVRISQNDGSPRDYSLFASRREELGSSVSMRIVPLSEEAWWFQGGRPYEEERSLATELAQVTGDWIVRALLREAVAR